MKTARAIARLIADLCVFFKPRFLYTRLPYRFAFIVHPRTLSDMARYMPILFRLPRRWVRFIERYLWPTTVSPIVGLRDAQGRAIEGMIISIPMTAGEMLHDRARALRQIRKATILARNRGARIAGLGGLTSSLSRGGEDVKDIAGIGITTGHAYTGYIVSETALSLMRRMDINPATVKIAIVGAGGSIGSITAELLARASAAEFILIDVPRKKERMQAHARLLKKRHPDCAIALSHDLSDLREAHVVITATNTPEALLRSAHIASGTVVVDDAQPADVHPEMYERDDVVVVAGGATHMPGIRTRFPLGLLGEENAYSCLAEVAALASQRHSSHYVIFQPTLSHVDEIANLARALSFSVASYQNEKGEVRSERLTRVAQILKGRLRTPVGHSVSLP